MNASLIATIAVIVFLIIFMVIGFYRGFLRVVLTTFSLVITLVLVGIISPKAADYLENGTVIGPRIQNSIELYVVDNMASFSGTASSAEEKFIDSLPITASMKADLKSRNTLGNYVDSGVNSFAGFMSVNLTTLIIKVLCYVIIFILVFLIIRLILRLSNLFNHIPVLGGINRILGAVLGLAEGVLVLWVICLIVMMLSATQIGISCQQVIAGSQVLRYIYEHNYIMNLVNSILGIFNINLNTGIASM